MDERAVDFNAMSERLSAQTEVYVEVASALVKIIENIATIRDRSNEIHEQLNTDYRVFNTKFQDLFLVVSKISTDIMTQHSVYVRDLSTYSERFQEVSSEQKVSQKMISQVMDCVRETCKDIERNNGNALTKSLQYSMDSTAQINNLSKQVADQSTQIANFKNHFDKFIMFIAVFSGIAMILGLLVATHVINISWLVH